MYEVCVVLVIISFCVGTYTGPNKIAIVNEEQTYINKSYQPCSYRSGCLFSNLPCPLLLSIPNTTEKEYYATTEEAQDGFQKGDVWAILHFTKNYSLALVTRIFLQEATDEDTLQQSQVKVWLRGDYANNTVDFQHIFKKFILNFCGPTFIEENNIGILVFYENVINPGLQKLAVVNKELIIANGSNQFCLTRERATTAIMVTIGHYSKKKDFINA
ncbi:unnamed protein product [Diabrotica balteata]|uniref:Uncharacterized protein n=1 Tax=Diabrotica balteata TaxID=107213 RepID=A0A9N9SZK6_DIABA|nr:unnamed protein product [Diabrotica balteata]